jgi:two-component system OmpR family sensor kinase
MKIPPTWRFLWALLPLALGYLLAAAAGSGQIPNPSLFLRANLAGLLPLVGIGLAMLVILGIAVHAWGEYQRMESREQAEKLADQDRRRFLQRLDHELKNPLTAIQAGLANLGERPDPETLSSVRAQTLRVSRLVADLRKLADLEVRAIEMADVDLSEILSTVVSLAQENPAAVDRRLTLSLPRAPWPLPHVSGDYDLLLLAVHNLVDNALKFTRPGDTIEVRAFEDGANVVIEIADTGPGIPTDELPFIWQELYRGQGARGVPGSGLGLALVRAILERHGGKADLRSRTAEAMSPIAQGTAARSATGTVFSVRLPVHAASAGAHPS